MKVGKHYVGKRVEMTWLDPSYDRIKVSDLKRGLPALCRWTEYGTVFDVTDGVVIIAHSIGREYIPGEHPDDELQYTSIPESLIETIAVLIPESDPSLVSKTEKE